MIDTTFVDLSTGGSEGTSTAVETSTTYPEVMTTTLEPDTATGSTTTSTATTEPILPECGDGNLDDGEECDDGANNADTGACTKACNINVCGDGLVRAGVEACDDGNMNGVYEHCDSECAGPGERCGDGVLQMDEGELCDDTEPGLGCLKECTFATSCAQIKQSWGDDAEDGIHLVRRMSNWLTVWCAMDADGGGYTILKHAGTTEMDFHSAKAAEQTCSSQYGMHLLAPRSQDHLLAIATAAADMGFGHVNTDDGIPGDAQAYLRIFGIYPVVAPTSCPGQAFNSVDCPQWAAKGGGPFWISDSALDIAEPSTKNCTDCSMEYAWDALDPPGLVGYQAFLNGGVGALSTHFLCEIGDKLP